MPALALTITGSGTSWAILHHGRPVGRYTTEGSAIAAVPGVQLRLVPAPARSCLCCGAKIKVEARSSRLARLQAQNFRLCNTCRKEAA